MVNMLGGFFCGIILNYYNGNWVNNFNLCNVKIR